MLAAHPDEAGFLGWYVVAEGALAGICGFKGPPDAAGEVEAGYAIIAPLRRRGFATRALRLLLDHAFADSRTTAVTAETLPHLTASRIVLDRCGFHRTGSRTDLLHGEILRYRCPRGRG